MSGLTRIECQDVRPDPDIQDVRPDPDMTRIQQAQSAPCLGSFQPMAHVVPEGQHPGVPPAGVAPTGYVQSHKTPFRMSGLAGLIAIGFIPST